MRDFQQGLQHKFAFSSSRVRQHQFVGVHFNRAKDDQVQVQDTGFIDDAAASAAGGILQRLQFVQQ